MTSSRTSSRMARRPRAPVPAQQRLLGHGLQRVVAELELDAVELEDPLVLLDQRVLRLDQDPDERVLVEAATPRPPPGAGR